LTADFLNKNGVVHRDLKPENILMTAKDSFEIRIADFGIAIEKHQI
jgi:serine/threonine protein kinase